MIYIIITLFFITIFNFLLFYKNLKNKKRNIKNYIDEKNIEIAHIKKELETEKNRFKEQKELNELALNSLKKNIQTARSQWEDEYNSHQAEAINRLTEWENALRARGQLELQNEFDKKRQEAEKSFEEIINNFNLKIKNTSDKLTEIKNEVLDYQKIQDAINEEIYRRRELEEKQDFYRIQLSQEAKEDIKLITSIRYNLHFRQNLDKLIYENYISKPATEMIKRVLNGDAPSGIYKITRLKTGEIYIGKSTDVKNRWQQHIKTVFNIGTIAHSILHTTMEKDGIENFTFELIEEVPKDNLTEREKFYIDFYNSKKYGLNEKAGG